MDNIQSSRTFRIGSYTVNITDDDGDIVAIFKGIAYRKKFPLNFSYT
jgi:acyl-CoA thioesterase